jgi:hypothetical protein
MVGSTRSRDEWAFSEERTEGYSWSSEVMKSTEFLVFFFFFGSRWIQGSPFRYFRVTAWVVAVWMMLKGQIQEKKRRVVILIFLVWSGNGELRYSDFNFVFWWICDFQNLSEFKKILFLLFFLNLIKTNLARDSPYLVFCN